MSDSDPFDHHPAGANADVYERITALEDVAAALAEQAQPALEKLVGRIEALEANVTPTDDHQARIEALEANVTPSDLQARVEALEAVPAGKAKAAPANSDTPKDA